MWRIQSLSSTTIIRTAPKITSIGSVEQGVPPTQERLTRSSLPETWTRRKILLMFYVKQNSRSTRNWLHSLNEEEISTKVSIFVSLLSLRLTEFSIVFMSFSFSDSGLRKADRQLRKADRQDSEVVDWHFIELVTFWSQHEQIFDSIYCLYCLFLCVCHLDWIKRATYCITRHFNYCSHINILQFSVRVDGNFQ